MGIKVNGVEVISDSKKGSFGLITTKAVSINTLLGMTGNRVGETVICDDITPGIVSWDGSKWNLPPPETSGGTEFVEGAYKYHIFTSPGIFASSLPGSGQVWVIAGGGGGGAGRMSGGGGAGGSTIFNANWDLGDTQVTVGQGGLGGDPWVGYGPVPAPTAPKDGQTGTPSAFGSYGTTGGGGCKRSTSRAGGSGGGASSWIVSGGPGISGQGYPGGSVPGPYPGQENAFIGTGGGGAGGAASPMAPANLLSGTGGKGVEMTWPIPSATGIAAERYQSGVAGGGSGYGGTHPYQPQGGVVPADPLGGGGVGNYSQPDVYRDAKGIGAGGGGGGFRDANNQGGGDGQPGIVMVRYLT